MPRLHPGHDGVRDAARGDQHQRHQHRPRPEPSPQQSSGEPQAPDDHQADDPDEVREPLGHDDGRGPGPGDPVGLVEHQALEHLAHLARRHRQHEARQERQEAIHLGDAPHIEPRQVKFPLEEPQDVVAKGEAQGRGEVGPAEHRELLPDGPVPSIKDEGSVDQDPEERRPQEPPHERLGVHDFLRRRSRSARAPTPSATISAPTPAIAGLGTSWRPAATPGGGPSIFTIGCKASMSRGHTRTQTVGQARGPDDPPSTRRLRFRRQPAGSTPAAHPGNLRPLRFARPRRSVGKIALVSLVWTLHEAADFSELLPGLRGLALVKEQA